MAGGSSIGDSVRTSVDESGGYGLYILTCSTVVDEDSICTQEPEESIEC